LKCFVAIGIGCISPSGPAVASGLTLYVIGEAREPNSAEVLYFERHYCSLDLLQCEIEYKDASGEAITRKTLNYRGSPNNPEVFVEAYRQESEALVAVSGADGVVVDAGFDNFVRSHWQELSSGDVVVFPFQALGFDEPFTMRAAMSESEECSARQLCLSVRLDSWLLNWLANPINLVYSTQSRRLLRFEGTSNIRAENGESMDVIIEYSYLSDG